MSPGTVTTGGASAVTVIETVDGAMTEETSFRPCSKKGEVRAEIATMLLDEIMTGNLTANIALCDSRL
jgi:hypothetical protein